MAESRQAMFLLMMDGKIVVDLNHKGVEGVLESAQQVVQLVVTKGVRALQYG